METYIIYICIYIYTHTHCVCQWKMGITMQVSHMWQFWWPMWFSNPSELEVPHFMFSHNRVWNCLRIAFQAHAVATPLRLKRMRWHDMNIGEEPVGWSWRNNAGLSGHGVYIYICYSPRNSSLPPGISLPRIAIRWTWKAATARLREDLPGSLNSLMSENYGETYGKSRNFGQFPQILMGKAENPRSNPWSTMNLLIEVWIVGGSSGGFMFETSALSAVTSW